MTAGGKESIKKRRKRRGAYIVKPEEALVPDSLPKAVVGAVKDRAVQGLCLETDLDSVERELDKLTGHASQLEVTERFAPHRRDRVKCQSRREQQARHQERVSRGQRSFYIQSQRQGL